MFKIIKSSQQKQYLEAPFLFLSWRIAVNKNNVFPIEI